jgi:hypothetical protein
MLARQNAADNNRGYESGLEKVALWKNRQLAIFFKFRQLFTIALTACAS